MDQKIESILDALNVAVFIVNVDQAIVYRNSASIRLFGTGFHTKKLAHFVPNTRCIRAVEDVLDGKSRQSVEVCLQLVVPTSFFEPACSSVCPDGPVWQVEEFAVRCPEWIQQWRLRKDFNVRD